MDSDPVLPDSGYTTPDPARDAHLTAMASLPDGAVVEKAGHMEQPDAGPGIILADSPRDLTSLIYWFLTRKGWQAGAGHVEEAVRRTGERAAAARAAGYQLIRYALIEYDDGYQSGWMASVSYTNPVRPVTKLAYATVFAACRPSSTSDLMSLRMMGYRDRLDVEARVRAQGRR